MKRRLTTVVLGCVALAACSGGAVSSGPTAPTPAAVVITKLTVTPVGGGFMLIGVVAPIAGAGILPPDAPPQLGAYATYSDGSARYVNAAWSSSDTNVLEVNSSFLKGVGVGTATVTASAEGLKASEQFTVDPGFSGNWLGTYTVDDCQGQGSLQELFCGAPGTGRTPGMYPVGSSLPIAMELSQQGNIVSGTISFGTVRGSVAGGVRSSGLLTLQGTATGSGITVEITHWDTRVQQNVMDGFINYVAKVDTVQGIAAAVTHIRVERK